MWDVVGVFAFVRIGNIDPYPKPNGFLNAALGRPKHEKAYMVVVVGLPDENAMVPDIHKYQLDEITSFDPK